MSGKMKKKEKNARLYIPEGGGGTKKAGLAPSVGRPSAVSRMLSLRGVSNTPPAAPPSVAAPIANLTTTTPTVTIGTPFSLTPTFSNGTGKIGIVGNLDSVTPSATSGTAVNVTPTSFGVITYILTVTNVAGDTATSNVIVNVILSETITTVGGPTTKNKPLGATQVKIKAVGGRGGNPNGAGGAGNGAQVDAIYSLNVNITSLDITIGGAGVTGIGCGGGGGFTQVISNDDNIILSLVSGGGGGGGFTGAGGSAGGADGAGGAGQGANFGVNSGGGNNGNGGAGGTGGIAGNGGAGGTSGGGTIAFGAGGGGGQPTGAGNGGPGASSGAGGAGGTSIGGGAGGTSGGGAGGGDGGGGGGGFGGGGGGISNGGGGAGGSIAKNPKLGTTPTYTPYSGTENGNNGFVILEWS